MQKFEELYEIFKEYNEIYLKIKKNSEEKLQMVKTNKFADFSDINEVEKNFVTQIKRLENRRSLITEQIKKKHNINDKDPKLVDLLKFCESEDLKKNLLEEKENLKKTLGIIQENNQKLSIVLNKTLKVLNYSIDLLTNQSKKDHKDAYTKNGSGIKKAEKKFKRLDLKI